MRCRPQCRQRLIWAYQPGPSSSKPSCGVSPSQSGQKRRNRSGRSHKRISLRQARADTDDQSPSAANKRCQKLRPVPLPRRPLLEATPPRPRVLRRVKGGAERAIISFSYKPPIFRASNAPAEGVRVARPRSPYTHVLRDSAQDYEAAAEPTDSGITVAEHAGCVAAVTSSDRSAVQRRRPSEGSARLMPLLAVSTPFRYVVLGVSVRPDPEWVMT